MRKSKLLTTFALCLLATALGASVALAAAGGSGRGNGGGRGRGGGGAAAGPRAAALTLTAPATPATRPDDEGFLRRWVLLEPIPAQGVSESAFHKVATKEYFPKEFSTVPRDGEKVTVDGTELTWHAYDSTRYNVNLYHFSYALSKPTNGVFWLAVTVINCPEEMKNVRLAVGSNDASVWWVNGEELLGLYDNRMDTFDDGVSKRITLKKGPNVIRAAICNEMGPSDFCARILDENDKPVRGITLSLGDATK